MPDPEPAKSPPPGVPKRKPVPIPTSTPAIPPTPPQSQSSPTKLPAWSQFSRRKRIIILSAVIGVVLLALIIGLSVGLTRHSKQNLPLPTNHGGPYTGDLTYYDPGLGSCGISSSSSDLVCAVSHVLFDAASTGSNPNANPLCGLMLRVKKGDSSVDVRVVDRCPGCKVKDLDVSPTVFKKLADMDLGRVSIQWAWLQDSPVGV
ncbi:RlpA-like double-psi beta-barrel-protein domain-containing protein-containing protein [Aspergillus avenaceus]|uniref:RlpA-like double-psi beta-barrel-protein domain-containing protein-containing protein n=1 Tax=Aspergillus avenaceus TaxID=36643 RepID=A0A5N6U7V8_ASPAV|nr:RlpA-like double-psi beta-barrel-protein domain-containing protein-containing protein [Aspergillus avenaceus]